MPSDESVDAESEENEDLLVVWPTELREEWTRRTRYGKLHFLGLLPGYVAAWLVLAALAGVLLAWWYALVWLCRGARALSRLLPDKHREEVNAE